MKSFNPVLPKVKPGFDSHTVLTLPASCRVALTSTFLAIFDHLLSCALERQAASRTSVVCFSMVYGVLIQIPGTIVPKPGTIVPEIWFRTSNALVERASRQVQKRYRPVERVSRQVQKRYRPVERVSRQVQKRYRPVER